MNTDERMDRLLERTSRAGDARPPGVCLDAETLAAWIDGSLTPAERTTAETHVADCDRCLAVLAALAKTAPPPTAATRPSWLSIRWLVPLTTAAVAITAWVVVQDPVVPPRPDTPAASIGESRGPAEVGKPAGPPPPAARDSLAEPSPDARRKSVDPSPPATSSRERAEARAVPPPAAAAPAAPEPRQQLKDEVQSMARANPAPARIVSPDPSVSWRIAGATVQRSTDGGQTWHAQATGTHAELLAGTSPAPTVCWIVGRDGTVLVTTDGDNWRRLDFPDPAADLVAVTAPDAATATVTAADGRRYRTTDAGRTWILQEKPATPF